MTLLVWIVLFIAGFIILALLLPVKIYFHTAGGTDKGFEVIFKTMIFYGLIGGGMHYCGEAYRAKMFLCSWKVLDADVTSIIVFISSKAKKRAAKPLIEEKIEKRKEKPPLLDRVKSMYRKTSTYWEYSKVVFRDFRDTIRFDQFSSNITLGLGNPAVTGWIIGIIYAVNDALPESCVITPSWDFTRQVIGGDISISLTFISLRFWKNLILHMPEIVRLIVKLRKHSHTIIAQEV